MIRREVVKSVERVFAVLELFQSARKPLTASEICKHLGYPPSSAAGLLKSMAELGYLAFDRITFTYLPTLRVPLATEWIRASHSSHWNIARVMDEIFEETGETVSLNSESDGEMRCVRLRPSEDMATFAKLKEGDATPLFASAIGTAALSRRRDLEIARLAGKFLKPPPGQQHIDLPDILDRVRFCRESGYARHYRTKDGRRVIGVLAWLVPSDVGEFPLVLGVGGPAARVRSSEKAIVTTVRSVFRQHRIRGTDE